MPLQEQLGTKLCSIAGLSSEFFCNSGLEANEAALNYARKFAVIKSVRNPKIIVFNLMQSYTLRGNYSVIEILRF